MARLSMPSMRTIGQIAFCGVILITLNLTHAADTISEFKATESGTILHITASADDAGNWANTQLFIDSEADKKTGYQIDVAKEHLFDFMVEGATVYHFHGSDSAAWAWDKVGTAQRKADGNGLSMDIDLKAISPAKKIEKCTVLLRALTADYQQVLAASPVTQASLSSTSSSPSHDAPSAATGFSAALLQDNANLVITVKALKASDLDTILIFFDTDENASTGFQPPADPHFGFEDMIQGESLSAHTGDTRDGWNWTTVSPVKKTVDGTTAKFSFNAALLKSAKIRVAVWQMSPDWQSRTDQYPGADVGTIELKLDASKLRTEADRPPMPFASARANRDLPARDRFQKISTYCCYYGPGKTSDLSHFDAVILHTPAQTAADIKPLKDLGVVTIGYVSVGEDEQLRVGDGKGPGGKASWYFDKNGVGQPDRNATWNSYFANAADPKWRADRVAEAQRLCGSGSNGLGFDGIFLDTVETSDSYPQSRAGMIQLIGELRAALPDKVIVINRGFSLLKEADVSSRIDGLMFESFSDSYDFDSKDYVQFAPQDMDATRQIMVHDVFPATKKYPLRVLALDYCRPDQTDRIQTAFDRAVSFEMVPAVAPISLDAVYDISAVKAKSDPKYLSKQATPESLRITLEADRNGFPAGTVIEPSSCFLGYSVAAIVDGIKDRQSLYWSKSAWASAEEPGAAQQLEFMFPTAVQGGVIHITFAYDNHEWKVSQQMHVESQADGRAEWVKLSCVAGAHTIDCNLPATPIHRLRIVQDAGGGSTSRPDLMWIAQVERTQ